MAPLSLSPLTVCPATVRTTALPTLATYAWSRRCLDLTCWRSLLLAGIQLDVAFPSLNHVFVWKVLKKYGIPKGIINAIKGMYYNHSVKLRRRGRLLTGFIIGTGIKQGCPCSGSIFALALDPFIRYLLTRVPAHSLQVRAFADDLGALIHDVIQHFPKITAAFASLAIATCLHVHPGKTQICIKHIHVCTCNACIYVYICTCVYT